jgi:hypothetical protein
MIFARHSRAFWCSFIPAGVNLSDHNEGKRHPIVQYQKFKSFVAVPSINIKLFKIDILGNLPIAYDRLWVGGYVYRKKIRI